MLIQAKYNDSQASLRLLEQLDNIEEFRHANVKIFLDSSCAEDQKLLKQLSARLADNRVQLRAQAIKITTIAAVLSIIVIAFGLTTLL